MSRPAGDPAVLGAGARTLVAAAEALRAVRGRVGGAGAPVVVAGAWRGPASEAFQVDDQAMRLGLERAAAALGQAAGAVAELAARLGHAQATWDEARRLAASAGLTLDRDGAVLPSTATPTTSGAAGLPASGAAGLAALLAASPAAGLAVRMAAAAVDEAAAARRTAAGRLDQVPAPGAPPVTRGAGHGAGAGARGGAPGGGAGANGAKDAGGDAKGGARGDGGEGTGWRRRTTEALETGREVATGVHHLLAGAGARLHAAGRTATAGADPAARMAATRVLETAGRLPLAGGAGLTLPLAGSALDLAAGLAEGEPLPRAVARTVGGAVGADLGARVGMAACGGQAAVTQGAGLAVCPVLTVVTGAVGAEVGRRAAVRLYDEVFEPPEAEPVNATPG
jgi:hypothetical protein